MKLPSPSAHNFAQVPKADIPRSSFNRNSGFKGTMDSGFLVPFYVDEVLPGDTVNLTGTVFARLSTPIVPLMDNMYVDTFFFFVPNRLVWDNWQRFNGEQPNPGDSTDFLVPQIVAPAGGWLNGQMADYFGLPTGIAGISANSLPFRAYNLIWNEWFRDQNLQTRLPVAKGDGPDTAADYSNCKRRGKRHDYFTSCLPWAQKGPAVPLPIGNEAQVKRRSNAGTIVMYNSGTNTPSTASSLNVNGSSQMNTSATTVNIDPNNTLYADLSGATASTINALRQSFQIQRLYERDARGGTRYTEIIRSHFGVTSSDARLQRPEYLGGGSTPINFNAVAQTSATASQPTPLGNLSATATMSSSRQGFVKSFTEHGIIIGLVSVRADLSYQQGINRMFSRRTRFDYYWPALSHIGEQAVLNKEIYAQGTAADEQVFGYQERYAEYRFKPSKITGQFRSTYAQPLDMWHLAQKFTTLPVLGDTFIQENPPVSRILAVPSSQQLLLDAYFQETWARPMPTYSVPGLIDHF